MAHRGVNPGGGGRGSPEATQKGVQRPAGPEWGIHMSLGWTVAASDVIKSADWMGSRAGERPQAARENSYLIFFERLTFQT